MRIIVPQIGARCFDHFGELTPEQAAAMKGAGFDGTFAYVEDLTSAQLQVRLAAGLWVAFVIEGLGAAIPTAALGESMGTSASALLRAMSVPAGVTVFADLEDGQGTNGAPSWQAFGAAVNIATAQAGDIPGAYVAEGTGMTGAELYALPARRYWKGAARILDRFGQVAEPDCDWCVIQGRPIDYTLEGVRIDFDVAWQDNRGRMLTAVSL
jgi:Domain of unknown function (DUF1906)